MAGWFNQKNEGSQPSSHKGEEGRTVIADEEEWTFEAAPPQRADLASLSKQAEQLEQENDQQLFVDPELLPDQILKDAGVLTKIRIHSENRALAFSSQIGMALEREYELGSIFNFVPVCVGLGILAYFIAPQEPSVWVLISTLLALVTIAPRIQSRAKGFGLIMAAICLLGGMTAAKVEVERARMPVPLSSLTGKIEGVVLAVDQNRRGSPRYLIRPVKIETLTMEELPNKIRLSSASKHRHLKPGQMITGLARMQPLPGPAFPGGYDFAFAAWMRGLGLSGFFLGAPSPSETRPVLSLREQANVYLQTARSSITKRLRAGLPGEGGDIAAALITGDRSGLSNETQESLRRSGLAHILAISGLHMALVTLTVIWIARFILVLIPSLANRYPVKKWAIIIGFVTATLYLFISGASIATQRAWIMITVMLAASLLDRRAITMRSVAIAALIILVLSPSSLLQPGFQMSFAAVAALVAIYRDWSDRKRRLKSQRHSVQGGVVAKLAGYFGGLGATSLIAGSATALIAMWHFHRVAPMGLVSNLIAMPLVSLFVMPLSLSSMFLMPYGFEELALAPLGIAIGSVVDIADWVNSFELDFETGAKPKGFLLLSALLLVLLCGFRTRLRFLALVPLVGIVVLSNQSKPLPDMIIAQDGRSIAIRSALLGSNNSEAEAMTLIYPARGKFITDIWQRAYLPNQKFAPHDDPANCTRDRCWLQLGNKSIGIIYDPSLIKLACSKVDILVAPRLWWVNCYDKKPDIILKRGDFEANGTHIVDISSKIVGVSIALPISKEGIGRRPWLQRFDNISRRYPPKTKTNYPKPVQ